ncbi:MAG: glycosyltransferase family 39 protein [Sphingomicrobium sp.]
MEVVAQSASLFKTVDRAWRDRLLIIGFLALASLFLFLDARTTPVILWDESRNVVNALEMRRSGPGLVTTYGFAPDLWNTKPPLLIWLMTGSMALFGPSEWAMRLPSALAGLGTLLILILFVRRVTGSIATALIAATILLLSPGFFGEHGARTADYDAVLLFFVTAALQLLFFAVHRARPATRELIAIGALIGAAAMTKSIAGFIPCVGPLLYLLAHRRMGRVVHNWRNYLPAVLAALVPLFAYYAAREAAAPGYLAAVLHNDMGGRFSQSLIGKTTSGWFYTELLIGWFLAGPLLLLVPLALRDLQGKSRTLMMWSLYTAISVVIIYSFSSTRLVHYALPAFPPLSIIAALTLRGLHERFVAVPFRAGNKAKAGLIAAAGLLAILPLGVRALHWRYEAFPARQFDPQASYGALFAQLHAGGVRQVSVLDPGFSLEGAPGYTPLLHAYRLIWSESGLVIDHRLRARGRFARVVASCEPVVARQLARVGETLLDAHGCRAIH